MPSIRQAIAVSSRAGHNISPETERISEVILTPRPVWPSTPMTILAQMIIAAIIEICLPALIHTPSIRARVRVTDNVNRASMSSITNEIKMAMQAAYWGVKPPRNIRSRRTPKGTAKNNTVTTTSRVVGRSSRARPAKS